MTEINTDLKILLSISLCVWTQELFTEHFLEMVTVQADMARDEKHEQASDGLIKKT